jgi:ribosome-associated toxin RatA of RatAB toxin-antitoxin module
MHEIRRSARVPYSAEQMLTLVNDIEAYPEFLHWCHAARIDASEGGVVDASLEIGVRGIHRTMRTRNRTETSPTAGAAHIRIEMIDGPLKHMRGGWTFTPCASGGCDVELRLEYEVHRTPFGLLLKTLFDEIANSQLRAFIRRADAVYAAG